MACIFQDVPTNFDTDLFMPIIKEIEKLSNQKYVVNNYFVKNIEQTKINKKIKIIADHIRAIVLTIQDGAKPSNTKRGYIIRRLIRRAYRNGIQLGIKEKTFLSNLIPSVNLALQVYKIDKKKIQTIIEKEELIFSKTIKKGEKILLEEINKNNINFDPNIAFKLFETYGFPIELTKEILAEKNINLNMEKYYKLLKEHSKKSKTKKLNVMKKQLKIIQLVNKKISHFIGYENTSSISNLLHQVKDENKYYVILDKTPFYATKGGQLHD
jgi:alanyl-tRNA synthetase